MPWPSTKNGEKLSAVKAVTPSTRNSVRTASLMNTMIVFVRADSRTPIIRTPETASTRNIAGRLNWPPSSPGGLASDFGSATPNSESSSSFRYAPQPIATPAIETPYSRIRSQPMIHAASSPSVA